MNCKWCGKDYEKPIHGQRKLLPSSLRPKAGCCTTTCYNNWLHSIIRKQKIFQCKKCGSDFVRGIFGKTGLCDECLKTIPQGLNGPDNPNWKGGHRCWMPGRYGKDKDGLSWKSQRKLAFERDGGKCQDPECKGIHERICVHHKIPYRISFSHALDNLICLCDGCHGRQEAKITAPFGGCPIKTPQKAKELPVCPRHGRHYSGASCRSCAIERRNMEIIKERLTTGISFPKLAKKYGFKTHASLVFMMQDFKNGRYANLVSGGTVNSV